MAKFVKNSVSLRAKRINLLRDCFVASLLAMTMGCASTPTTGYISRTDRSSIRTFNADFGKITGAVEGVLKARGWKIIEEDLPSVYERDEHYDNNGFKNLLIMTYPNNHQVHLNVLIHSIQGTSDIEVRPSIKSKQLVNSILDAIEDELSRE